MNGVDLGDHFNVFDKCRIMYGENGSSLTPSIDHLFDRGFIGSEDNRRLIISPAAPLPSLENKAAANVMARRTPRIGLPGIRGMRPLEAIVGSKTRAGARLWPQSPAPRGVFYFVQTGHRESSDSPG